MRNTLHTPLGPEYTPATIRWLILLTSIASLGLALFDGLSYQLYGTAYLQWFFSLTPHALWHGFLWQPLTYFFIQSATPGLHLFLLIQLVFYMYILWALGTLVCERVGQSAFLRMYLLCGIFPGLTALFTMQLTGQYQVLAGSGPCISGLLLVWAMLYPNQEVLLFFLFPIKARWLVAGFCAALLLVYLSALNFVGIVHSLSAFSIGYLYAAGAWGLDSPFSFLHPLDRKVAALAARLRRWFAMRHFEPPQAGSTGKIWSFKKSGKEMDDEEFLDKMLEKISKQGEQSLSSRERQRLKNISIRKNKK